MIKKYKGLPFFNADDEGGYFRIMSDRFSCKGKRAGGWVVVCDKISDDDPAHDPVSDAEIEAEGHLIEYLINAELHEMIAAARQLQRIMLVPEGAE